MPINTKYRSEESEIMDNFAMEGEILQDALDKIAQINQLLGGNQLTLQGVQNLIEKIPKKTEITILDVGCGNGDILRILADYGLKNHFNFKLIGIDANNFTVNYARELSKDYSNIRFQCENIFSEAFAELKQDIALCTLTLHHFKDDEIIQLMTVLNANSRVGIVINDLHRSTVSYRLFQVLCFVFRLNPMSREDGLISILRGFKKEELVHFSKKIKLSSHKIQWKWAFRYQWIIEKVRG
jgi:2-polyprenyl-3-methyl-5-hydroxy-6-metoxy-1,4-benzoquinol methylase